MSDKTPPQIRVWVCSQCGYWRKEEGTGSHQRLQKNHKPERHELVEAAYVFDSRRQA